MKSNSLWGTKYIVFLSIVLITTILSCSSENENQAEIPFEFSFVPITESKLDFRNDVSESNLFNFINYLYIYNGGGVATGDINNDGLIDIYFSSNQASNKLYLNKGGLKFEDVTKAYGVEDNNGWSTGVSMVDINNDGWLDIYVCKSASLNNDMDRQNKLFVNQQGKGFIEKAAEFGLNDKSYSTQAYFFDYDNDSDLDMYLVNHRVDYTYTYIYNTNTQDIIEPLSSDKLYRNDNGKYVDVTKQSGLENKTWGLSAAISDFNDDGWLDIYVCNDFIYGDQLMINNQKGGFENKVYDHFNHIPFFSMGSDVADINNDKRLDLIVVDMISEDHVSNKKLMAGMSTPQFNMLVELGNHYQYMTNVLQLNRGNGIYSDIAYSAGIANTDWSWAPLIADYNNDGLKDLFITNGIKRDMTDNDFKAALEERAAAGPVNIEDIFEIIPSRKLKNYAYVNQGDTKFHNATSEWGLNEKVNSNGAAYADFDNDGDLDLVLNNLGDYASLYENKGTNNYVKVKLKGPAQNTSGIGTQLKFTNNESAQFHQHFLNRGFQSSVADEIIFGLGSSKADSDIFVEWPDGKTQTIKNLKANTTVIVDYKNADNSSATEEKTNMNSFAFNTISSDAFNYVHEESKYDDFKTEILLPQKYSNQGPYVSIADVNGDGLQDAYISGAKDMAGQLKLQQADGSFKPVSQGTWDRDKAYEDLGSIFIDADQDGDMDLYVVSGSNEFVDNPSMLQDRFYINDGSGNFKRSDNSIPVVNTSGYKVIKGDYDQDGDDDLFVAGRVVPGRYPYPASSKLLRNDGGIFKDVTMDLASFLNDFGMVTDAVFTDFDKDNDIDILLVGEWMGLNVLENNNNQFTHKDMTELSGRGWWFSITHADLNNDGIEDYVLGNLGANNKFGASEDKLFHVFCNDFDASGNLDIVLSKEKQGKLLPVRGRECSSQQMPFIKAKFPNFKSFAESDLPGIYGEQKIKDALHYTADNFESIALISNADGSFKKVDLPKVAQYGPLLSSLIYDFNKDGNLDIIGAGNIYDTEVETVRYDASKGFVLLGDGSGNFRAWEDSGFIVNGDVKQLVLMEQSSQPNILVMQTMGKSQFFKIPN